MKQLLTSVTLLLLVAGCNRRPMYGATSSGSYGDPDHKTNTNVVTQRDAKQNLLFAIAWTAERGGWAAAHSGQNLLTSIDGHPVRPDLQKKALYALQPDRTLREIPLSDADLTALFNEMNEEGFNPLDSELWQKQVGPKLSDVEPAGVARPT